jgi:DNA-directed RNA polymerase subunit L
MFKNLLNSISKEFAAQKEAFIKGYEEGQKEPQPKEKTKETKTVKETVKAAAQKVVNKAKEVKKQPKEESRKVTKTIGNLWGKFGRVMSSNLGEKLKDIGLAIGITTAVDLCFFLFFLWMGLDFAAILTAIMWVFDIVYSTAKIAREKDSLEW